MNPQSILIVGCGQLGNAMAPMLEPTDAWRVFGMRRNVAAVAPGIEAIEADYTDANAFANVLQRTKPDYVVLTLTPAARTAEAYETCYVQAVRNLLAGLNHSVRQLVFVSSTSVYSQHNDEWIDETSPAEPTGFSGQTMLECERLLKASGLSFTALRCGGIYGAGSGRLLTQISKGDFSSSKHYTNRIHFKDSAAAIVPLLEKRRRGDSLADIYLGVDSSPCRKTEIEQWLAEQLGVAYTGPSNVDSTAKEVAARQPGSKRCSNKRLLDSGFEFQYPSYKEGYAAMIRERR